ncbi:hypothetical protein SAMN04244572_00943 [Azotobacter beijerinckii]|uniref:Uncharacterized protein n=1 Tax=Azotobacter beijerinckii TaxID=170623 RepID=A0A1H9KGD8_9GAMM|nr:hypothetical protein SAMN04244572_00943 [Azotobacter beijerinckii]SEQ98158.1 hypothetical protein SAMN04244573_02638 [Azotobacter beijerinckii]
MVGMVPLNTSSEAVLMKATSIQPRRRSRTPRNSMAKTGAVMPKVCENSASMGRVRETVGPYHNGISLAGRQEG